MNHGITHCLGIKGNKNCEDCMRRKAHEELQVWVRQGRAKSGMAYSYLKAEECVEEGYSEKLIINLKTDN